MFIHNKDLQFEVRVSEPDPRLATLLQEQFGGASGELKAAMQYFTQAFVLREKGSTDVSVGWISCSASG